MTITPDAIADALDAAPAWAKLGLTQPSQRLRDDARREMAQYVYSALYQPIRTDRDQLALPL
jgi:hypothetical protein